jgi:hypothetical protein
MAGCLICIINNYINGIVETIIIDNDALLYKFNTTALATAKLPMA